MRIPRRHMLWFSVAILVPCLALVGLTVRLLEREGQLASQRRVEEARRKLLAEIEPLRLGQGAPAGLAFHGIVRGGRAVASWELPEEASGEMKRLEQAVARKDGEEFRRLAELAPHVTDEYAVPVALYAIPHVAPSKARLAALSTLVGKVLDDPHRVSPAGLHLLLSLVRENSLPAGELAQVSQRASAGERFVKEYPGGAAAGGWVGWGEPLVLIGFSPSARAGELVFRAVPAGRALSLSRGDALGEPFQGVRIQLPAPGESDDPGRRLLLMVLGLTLALALAGGLLLWRDIQREKALAGLRTQFIASVSHELRTPLTAVRMFIESLRINPDLDQQTRSEYLDTMLRETERLSRLVNNVLEFSRMERNQKRYVVRPVALGKLVGSVVRSFRPLIAQAGYSLRSEIDDAGPEVKADPDALEQAIVNLLSNAMKYSGNSREIHLKLQRGAGRAEISVRDFGVGISAGQQRHIFESFYRAASPENENIQGAGLGLTVVKHVMEGHGGDVIVESEPGKGSTFTLVLPLA